MIAGNGWLGRWEALGRPFLQLPRFGARLLLALIAAAMIGAAWAACPAPGNVGPAATSVIAPTPDSTAHNNSRGKGDMALYARIAERMTAGEGYYEAALSEQRASSYPTAPFVAVRLPTLAWVQAGIGVDAVRYAALLLTAACVGALMLRRTPLHAAPAERLAGAALLALGGAAVLSPVAGYDHDFIAGLLLTLALLAYRPGRWWPALIAVGAALAVRELAAPFAVLWLAFAAADRRWAEAAAVAALLALFAGGMALHHEAVAAHRLASDLVSQGWAGMEFYGLPIAALGQLTGLRFLPASLAAPLALLPLVGWAGLGGRLGLMAALWCAGLFTVMALFARTGNYYWAELALPAYAVGLAFAPRAIAELLRRAFGRPL